MKKLILASFIFACALALTFCANFGFDKNGSNEKNLTTENAEALAAPFEIGYCFYNGSVDCPRGNIKVYYVIL